LAPGEAPPILREVMINAATRTVLLPSDAGIRKIAGTLAGKLQDRKPQIITPDEPFSTAPVLVIGLDSEVDAWLAARRLPAKPDEINNKGTAQVWTLPRTEGRSLTVIAAKDAASLEALIRPLPHYGRQSYLAFDGRQAIEKGVWPMLVQKVVVK